MADSLNRWALILLQKSLDECTEEELYNYSKRNPFFAPAQFLYLKKLTPQSEAYQKQYQKALLYYKEPTLFNHFINKEEFETEWKPLPVAKHVNAMEPEPINVQEASTAPTSIVELPSKIKDASEAVITFEPFHTVDYFASQGIKLSVEEASKDKFGKQLKSFTEWLKTMKRLPATQMTTLQGQAEKKVENLAAHSVQKAEVVTEAMAEVWLQQGNKAKAVEVYRKLSLLNPSKSAYFAAKIEHLNHSN